MPMLTSITVVTVVNDVVVSQASFAAYIAVLEQHAVDFDFVLVANSVDTEAALQLKTLVAQVPDTTIVFLGEPVHDDLARLVGIDHAVGDHVLFCDMLFDAPAALPPLLAELAHGYDLVVAESPANPMPGRPLPSRLLVGLYARVYTAMTTVQLDLDPTGLRVMSRSAALFLAGRANAELLMRAKSLGRGFPAISLSVMRDPPPLGVARTRLRRHTWSKGVGMLLSVSTLPLRGASYGALLGGVLSVLYSVYVFAVYLFKPDVAAGWTTISLQLAVMMFIFSMVLLFIGEYVLQIHSASPPRGRRYLVLRELRSPLSRRSRRLNIVDAEGRFQLGRPAWLARSPADAQDNA